MENIFATAIDIHKYPDGFTCSVEGHGHFGLQLPAAPHGYDGEIIFEGPEDEDEDHTMSDSGDPTHTDMGCCVEENSSSDCDCDSDCSQFL